MKKKKVVKPKKNFWRRNLDLLLVSLIFVPLYYGYIFTQPVSPFLPREEPFALFERHVHFSVYPPFASAYFLMLPQNYDPEKYTYPLIMMLHGASSHMYGGKVLMHPDMRARVPAIVLIPMTPFGFTWASLGSGLPKPSALPLAVGALRDVMKHYSVDPDKVYVTGYSMGGIGTYAAIARYHDLFAAAVPIDAHWPLERLKELDNVPLWVLHGRHDQSMPVTNSRQVTEVLKASGRPVYYTEHPQYGHGSWEPTYDSPAFWSWLLQQSKR